MKTLAPLNSHPLHIAPKDLSSKLHSLNLNKSRSSKILYPAEPKAYKFIRLSIPAAETHTWYACMHTHIHTCMHALLSGSVWFDSNSKSKRKGNGKLKVS